jgi:hypothetical protein
VLHVATDVAASDIRGICIGVTEDSEMVFTAPEDSPTQFSVLANVAALQERMQQLRW